MKHLVTLLAFAFLGFASPALAASCGAYPFTLTNGQLADANQVMSNFNSVRSCVTLNTAASGANSDITSLSGLTTALTKGQGGTGNTTGDAATLNSQAGSYYTGFATTAASTAQTNAETYAASAASTAQTNAETYAASAASTAQSNAETYANGTSSLTANGYQIFPSGLIMEWGSFSCTSNSSGTITLPYTFPNNFFSVAATTGGHNGNTGQFSAGAANNSQFTYSWGATLGGSYTCTYIATGD